VKRPAPGFAVLGPGGVGGLVAGALTRAGQPVTVIAREATAVHIAEHGLHVDSATLGSFTARPRTVSQLPTAPQVLVVATKAGALAAALERLGSSPALVLPLLNGVEHVALLRSHFDAGDAAGMPTTVLAGTIRVEAQRVAMGHIVHTSPTVRIELASDEAHARPAMQRLARTLEGAGLPALIRDAEADALWSKLVRLNALACTTAAFDLPLGPIRSEPRMRADLLGAVQEGAAVARAEEANLDPAAALDELDRAHPTLSSSMARDIAAGRESELDAIAGAVLRAAARHQIACPTIERLVGLIERRIARPARPAG
jgi:2-dehydropantoate 2-reductase